MKNKNVLIINIIVIYLLSFFVTGSIFGQEKVDNAEILYYQAFLICPDHDKFSKEFINFGCGFTDSSPELLQYDIVTNRYPIKLFTRAAEIQKCNWLIQDRDTGSEIIQEVRIRIPTFMALIGADARNCAINGEFITAFDKCRTMFQFTKHLELLDDNILIIYDINTKVYRCFNKILDIMPSDVNNLKYIEKLLAEEEVRQSFKKIMFKQLDSLMKQVNEIDIKQIIKEQPIKDPNYESYRKELLNMGKEDIIKIIHQDLNSFFSSVFDIIESNDSYSQKYIKIRDINKDFEQQAENNPAIPSEIVYEGLENIYNLNIRYISRFNALRAAVEIYLVKARTGQLPKQLPDGLAKDPYSGQDFEYILTDNGFKLRCREKDIDSNKFGEFEFKVK